MKERSFWFWFLMYSILVIGMFLLVTIPIYAITKPYLYQGLEVTDLTHYQLLIKNFSSGQKIQATAYDSINDKILVTYNFVSGEEAANKYSLPQGIRYSYWAWLASPSGK